MVEKKAYQRCEGEQSQRLPESVQTEPGHERRGRGRKKERGNRSQEPRRPRDKETGTAQMARLYREVKLEKGPSLGHKV